MRGKVRRRASTGQAKKLESDTGVVIGSMDIEALYPFIQVNKSAGIVGELVEESIVEICNVDYDTAVRFISSNSSKSEYQ